VQNGFIARFCIYLFYAKFCLSIVIYLTLFLSCS